jgi:hypothetical protein
VEAQLAYVELDGSPVFVVVSDMAPLPGAGATDVLLHSADLRLVQPPPEVNCERYGALLGSGLGGDPPSPSSSTPLHTPTSTTSTTRHLQESTISSIV